MARFMEDVDDLKPSPPLEPPTPTLPTVSPAIPSQQSTGSAAVAPVLAPTPVVAPPVNDLSISDITARMGVAIDSLDDPKIGWTDGLDLVRPVSGNSVRVALLTRYLPAKVAYVHYVKGHGLPRCLSPDDKAGLCSIMLKDSQPEFVALVLSYTNANLETGRYDKEYATGQYPTIRWTIGYLRLSMCGYRQLSQIVKEKERQKNSWVSSGSGSLPSE
jgi:hypothetical protein